MHFSSFRYHNFYIMSKLENCFTLTSEIPLTITMPNFKQVLLISKMNNWSDQVLMEFNVKYRVKIFPACVHAYGSFSNRWSLIRLGDCLNIRNTSNYEEKYVGFIICIHLKMTLYSQSNPPKNAFFKFQIPKLLNKNQNWKTVLPLPPKYP